MNPSVRTVELGERSYDVFFSPHAWPSLREWITRTFPGAPVYVVTDDRVLSLYEEELLRSLDGIPHHVLALPHGEEHKNLDQVRRTWSFLSAKGADRRSLVLAFGGGVTGDLAGFAASTWLRGIPFVQLPTTLLAQVDSSVGGKTGFNTAEGKNLVGTFWQPRAVFVDPSFLRTLDGRNLAAGYAEVVKCALAGDPVLWGEVERARGGWRRFDEGQWQEAIRRSVDFKARLVETDEREEGERKLLNLGHTVGHAFEQAGEYVRMLHGEAVALGLCWEAVLSRRLGVASSEVEERVVSLLLDAGYRLDDPAIPLGALSAALGVDKKRAGDEVVLPLLDEPGKCILMSVPVARLREELPAVRAFLKERLRSVSTPPEAAPEERVAGDPGRAVADLEAQVAADPRDVRPLRLLADAYRRTGRLASAWETAKEALARDPGNPAAQRLAREIRELLDASPSALPEEPPSVLEGTLLLEDEVIEIGLAEGAPAPEPRVAAPAPRPAPPSPAVAPLREAEAAAEGGGEGAPPVRTVTMASLYWSQGNRETAVRIVADILRENPGDGRARAWLSERSLPVPGAPRGQAPPAAPHPKGGAAAGEGKTEGGRKGSAKLSSFLRKITKEYGHEVS